MGLKCPGVSRPSTGSLERGTWGAAGVHSAGQAGTECLHRKPQRTTARRMSERELVHESQRRTAKDRNLAAGLQRTTPTQFVELFAARRVCKESSGDDGMRKASTRLPEQGTQTPSPAPDLIPAETKTSTENSHSDWYSERGHFTVAMDQFNERIKQFREWAVPNEKEDYLKGL